MEIQEIKRRIEEFLQYANDNKIELYNEVSLQHELGIYLRNKIGEKYSVQFERNISFFGYDENPCHLKIMSMAGLRKKLIL